MGIPKCEKCNKEMRCWRNGIKLISNGWQFGDFKDMFELEMGNGDLYKCKECATYAVDGFNIGIHKSVQTKLSEVQE